MYIFYLCGFKKTIVYLTMNTGSSTSATSVANYFVDLANRDNVELKQFGLMKRVYITHGFCLAYYDMSALNPPYDVVEAWENGPVIPSVYYSFKYNRNNPIVDKVDIIDFNEKNLTWSYITPKLEDERVKNVADFVWGRYRGMSDYDLIKLTHRDGTPWAYCYRKGENRQIPDYQTKLFYKSLLIDE